MKRHGIFNLSVIVGVITFLAVSWAGFFAQRAALAEEGGVAVSGEKILVSLSNDAAAWNDDTLYAINPGDGSGQTRIFDFHSQSKFTTGEIFGPRISADGQQIYFHSEHAYIYTPARRNAFRVASDGGGLDQISPGPHSGEWGATGDSTVSGWVRKGDGSPWVNAPVYLEGMNSVFSGGDGSFSFQNVPPGARWLVAYQPGDVRYDSTAITVVSGVDNTGLVLTPDTTSRMNFEFPVEHDSRVYYILNGKDIQWTDLGFSAQHDVYTPATDGCVSLPSVQAFDVGPASGRLAVIDFNGDGCTNNAGIYVTDKDGGGKQLLLNLWSDPNWNPSFLPQEIFWSPDESKIAFKGNYDFNGEAFNAQDVLTVIDATNGQVLGAAFSGASNVQLTLYGWSPGGDWLLFSRYLDVTQKTLSKLQVDPNGTIDISSLADLMVGEPISGATWGVLADPGSPTPTPTPGPSEQVFLPVVSK